MPCCVGLECLAGFAVGNVVNIGRLYSQWRKHFKNRPRRQNAESHFNSRTPDVHSAEDTYSSIRDAVIKRRGSLGAETTPEMIAPKDPAKKNRRVACPFVSTDPESGKPLWLADTRTKLLTLTNYTFRSLTSCVFLTCIRFRWPLRPRTELYPP